MGIFKTRPSAPKTSTQEQVHKTLKRGLAPDNIEPDLKPTATPTTKTPLAAPALDLGDIRMPGVDAETRTEHAIAAIGSLAGTYVSNL
ncbi:MAG: hypothetical protein KDD56_10065, partial [Bdellovibrionales bacterium]|nr:hypothetical protein [Bdellovibrionales bacterium]